MDNFESRIARVNQLDSLTHDIVFTNGDIAPYNILVVEDGRISGLIDWEAAGYYLEYWEYTTAYNSAKRAWWFDLVGEVTDGRYTKEREGDFERWVLAGGTMI